MYSYERFVAVVDEHEEAIRMVAAALFVPGNYLFEEMMCDLTTYLWVLYRDMPPDAVVFRERRWVYTVLRRHALRLLRDEARYQQQLVYGADLTDVADDEGVDPLVKRMYYLVAHLGDDGDRELIRMYLADVPVRVIAERLGRNESHVYRRIRKIRDELRRLNAELGDDDDDLGEVEEVEDTDIKGISINPNCDESPSGGNLEKS